MSEEENICYRCQYYYNEYYDEYDYDISCMKNHDDLIFKSPKKCPDYTPEE